MRLLFLFLWVLSGIFSNISQAAGPVWAVSKGDHVIYIGGTIHLLKPSDSPYPAEFNSAYQQVEQVVFEIDIDAASAPAFAVKVMQLSTPSDNMTLKDRLSPAVFEMLVSYVTEQGLSIAQFNPVTPAFAALALVNIKYQSLGYKPGVDDYYFKKATDDGKQKLFFETPEEQLEFINSINNIDADELILSTLEDMSALADLSVSMIRAWREGNISALFSLVGDMKTDYPSVYDVMLTGRNQRWLPKINSIFNSQKPTLILVGALHLAGPDSVLVMLEKQGYHVEYAVF